MSRRPRKFPKIQCDATFDADWGYGPVEVHQCQRAATHRVVYVGDVLTRHGLIHGREKVLMCLGHSLTVKAHEENSFPYVERIGVYRFRRL